MASYSISDLERLLRVKGYVIRYWEKEMPLIQPTRDTLGRRVYSDRDLQLLVRLKYLLYERRFTVDGAKTQIYKELAGGHQDLRAAISSLRSELMSLFFMVHDSSCETANDDRNETPTEESGP
jgi:DNA-binding transcriptional MerR regulator